MRPLGKGAGATSQAAEDPEKGSHMTERSKATPADRWASLKARGNPTLAEIEAIDNATRWAPVEPQWWLEMMDAARQLRKPANAG